MDKLVYSIDFRVIFTSCYEKEIKAYTFDKNSCYEAGELIGHNTQVCAMAILKDSPMIVTADIMHFVKTWDIRDFRLCQTLHFDCKGSIEYIFNISTEQFVLATPQRLHWFKYESKLAAN